MNPEAPVEEFCPVVHTTAEEIEREVAKYAQDRWLNSQEICDLVQRMVDSSDPVEQDELKEAIVRGWYGGVKNA